MLKPTVEVFALALVGMSLPIGAADVSRPNDSVHVEMQCNTMVGAFEVDPVAARAALPADYELALLPSGNALVYLQASTCDGLGNGEPVGAFDLADAWLAIQGPYDVDDVPGAYFTLPTLDVYVLKAQTTSKWVKTHCAAIYFPKELIRVLNVGGPISPLRIGHVEEMTGRGYSWSEFYPCMITPGSPYGECWMFPDPDPKIPVGFMEPTFMLGFNLRGYVDRSPGTGAKKEMQCLLEIQGQGLVQLQVDPKSNLADLGIFDDEQIGYFWDSISNCDLVMSTNK
jgi:hypothetical protein